MIVPRTRLLFWVAVIVLPFALLAAVAPGSATDAHAGDRRLGVRGQE